MKNIKLAQHGFTIVELMISTGIFSLILVLCASAVVTISRQYHKSSVSVAAQDTARNIIEELSRQLQLAGSYPVNGISHFDYAGTGRVYALCIGSTRYSYTLGWQVSDTPDTTIFQTPHAIWRDTIPNENVCVPADLSKYGAANPTQNSGSIVIGTQTYNANGVPGTGRELMPDRMRLKNFYISPRATGSDLWEVRVSVMFGDTNSMVFTNNADPTTVQNCLDTRSGGDFCAKSELATSVYRRFN